MDPVALSAAAVPRVKTWEEAYCARHGGTAARFHREIFGRALHRHALPLAPFLFFGNHFAADQELIAGCARARSMRQIREEIEDYRYHPLNRGWLRDQLALRVSTHRLRRLAREYLPGSKLPPPFTEPARSG